MYSPHAWGWTVDGYFSSTALFVFPTRVGMDRQLKMFFHQIPCILLTRGDGPSIPNISLHSSKYSPHAWGWTEILNRTVDRDIVFPTRVGMDRVPEYVITRPQGIPHTRGDGPQIRVLSFLILEYSPHAWGWTVHNWIISGFGICIPHTRGDGPRFANRLG